MDEKNEHVDEGEDESSFDKEEEAQPESEVGSREEEAYDDEYPREPGDGLGDYVEGQLDDLWGLRLLDFVLYVEPHDSPLCSCTQ